MGLGHIAVRALVSFIYLLMMTRVAGKRVVGQADPFDLVVALIVGDLIDDAIWADVSMVRFGAAAGTIFALDLLMKTLGYRWGKFYLIADGKPSILLRDGVEDEKALRSEQLTRDDLAEFLRLGGIEKWNEVKLAILDNDHSLSILRHWWSRPVQKKDGEAVR